MLSTKTPPPEQLRARLEAARTRDSPFDFAWKHALRNIDYPTETSTRREWREALRATEDEWRAAYLFEPPVTPGMATVAGVAA